MDEKSGSDAGVWLAYLPFLDSALPIGGFSHSFGLETLVQEERIVRPQDLYDYLMAMLYGSWASCELVAVKAVYTYAEHSAWTELWQIDRLLHVQRAAAESRSGQQKMGRRLLQLAQAMHPELIWEPLAGEARGERIFATHPIVHGWVARALGVPLHAAVHGYAYGCLSQGVGCALRLMRLGQTDGQRLLASLLPHIGPAWATCCELPPEQMFTAAAGAEVAMLRHADLYSRLFMS